MTGNLCIVTAVDIEYKTTVGLLADRAVFNENGLLICRGFIGNRNITLLKSEMGAIGFSERLETHLSKNRYDAVIVAGLAGALAPHLRSGHSVVYQLCRVESPNNPIQNLQNLKQKPSAREQNASIGCDSILSNLLFEKLISSGLPCSIVVGLTVDRIITGAKEKLSLYDSFKTDAVDMETYRILAVCSKLEIPCTALRVISDEANQDLPDFNNALGANGQLIKWRTGLVMIERPFTSIKFLFGLRTARTALRDNLKCFLNA